MKAIVSKPSFDPNVMTGHLTHAEYTLLMQDPRKPFIDKALRATYPPGSIFKFVTAIAALEDGQAAEDESMFCTGSYELSGTPSAATARTRRSTSSSAIQQSCDIYFWNLAQRIGLDRIAQVAREFGLGAPTNLGINGDSGGRIPTKEWYEEHGRYKIGYATNAAIGQGDVEVTVMQMAMAYAALANGGKLFVPQVVDRVESHEGRTIVAYDPKVARTVKVPTDAVDTWKRGMWNVDNEKGGTAFDHGHSDVVTVMGKTGTAEVKKHHKDSEHKGPREVESECLARVVRGVGAGGRSRARDRRAHRARRLRWHERVADRRAHPRRLLRSKMPQRCRSRKPEGRARLRPR